VTPDLVARDGWGAPLSAAERCHGCWHEWFAHDHAYAPYDSPAFGWCLAAADGARCSCRAFVPAPHGTHPSYVPSPITAPLPDPPARHRLVDPPTLPS
jgi:hypothetical protein